jgi:hypothetical protein
MVIARLRSATRPLRTVSSIESESSMDRMPLMSACRSLLLTNSVLHQSQHSDGLDLGFFLFGVP